jgi:hypothetical protein
MIQQTKYCGKCGTPFNPNDTHCGYCGAPRRNKASPQISSGMSLPPQLSNDTPPLRLENPTPQQIYAATTGTVNPYGYDGHVQWGQLVIDGSQNNPWISPLTAGGDYKAFKLEHKGLITVAQFTGGPDSKYGHQYGHIDARAFFILPGNYQDFAFQIQVTCEEGMPWGAAFRSDIQMQEGDVFYYNRNFWGGGEEYIFGRCDLPTATVKDSSSVEVPLATNGARGSTHLWAFVAQGPLIDIYKDLIHIKRVPTRMVKKGSIGLFLLESGWSGGSVEYCHTKLWVKNNY